MPNAIVPGYGTMTGVEVERLAAFLTLSEELSFRRAAARLHVATSPLSRYIRDLEVELGVRLFDRGTRHVRLTPAGDALIPYAQEILAAMAAAARSVRAAAGEAQALSVGMRVVGPGFQRAVEDVLSAGRPSPRIHVVPLESSVQLKRVLRGELDLAITLIGDGEMPAALDALPLRLETIGVALPDRPPYRDLAVVEPAHLAGLTVIAIGSAQAPTAAPGPARRRDGMAPYLAASAGSIPGADIIPGGIRTMIASGQYCAFAPTDPESPWHAAIAGDGVIRRPLPETYPPAVTAAVWRRSRALPGDLGEFIDALRRAFPEPLRV